MQRRRLAAALVNVRSGGSLAAAATWERKRAVSVTHDPTTGRPLSSHDDAVETLTDDELETELTVTAHDPVRRARRYDLLWRELISRQRGCRARRYGSL